MGDLETGIDPSLTHVERRSVYETMLESNKKMDNIVRQEIRDVLFRHGLAMTYKDSEPMKACELLSELSAEIADKSRKLPDALVVQQQLHELQLNIGDSLVEAVLCAIDKPEELQDAQPLLAGRLERPNALISLGLFLKKHQTSVVIGDETLTAEICAQRARELAPERPEIQQIVEQILQNPA